MARTHFLNENPRPAVAGNSGRTKLQYAAHLGQKSPHLFEPEKRFRDSLIRRLREHFEAIVSRKRPRIGSLRKQREEAPKKMRSCEAVHSR